MSLSEPSQISVQLGQALFSFTALEDEQEDWIRNLESLGKSSVFYFCCKVLVFWKNKEHLQTYGLEKIVKVQEKPDLFIISWQTGTALLYKGNISQPSITGKEWEVWMFVVVGSHNLPVDVPASHITTLTCLPTP